MPQNNVRKQVIETSTNTDKQLQLQMAEEKLMDFSTHMTGTVNHLNQDASLYALRNA